MDAATILAQLDHFSDDATGALVPSMQLGVTSRAAGDGDAVNAYGRSGNEAGRLLERVMVALEGGAVAASFGSATAIAQAILATLRPGAHVLFDSGAYYEFAEIFTAFGDRWGVSVDRVDATDLSAVQAALQPGATRLVWTECPSNPLWRVPDLGGAGAMCAGGRGATAGGCDGGDAGAVHAVAVGGGLGAALGDEVFERARGFAGGGADRAGG